MLSIIKSKEKSNQTQNLTRPKSGGKRASRQSHKVTPSQRSDLCFTGTTNGKSLLPTNYLIDLRIQDNNSIVQLLDKLRDSQAWQDTVAEPEPAPSVASLLSRLTPTAASPPQDTRSCSFQQALPHLARLSTNPAFVAAVSVVSAQPCPFPFSKFYIDEARTGGSRTSAVGRTSCNSNKTRGQG